MKKILLTTAALAGVGIAAYATKKTLDERKEAEWREQLDHEIDFENIKIEDI